jgi:glucan phosphorylase
VDSLELGRTLTEFDKKWTVQLNDTHPSIGIAELMRLLVDEHAMGWDDAWRLTQATFGYTNSQAPTRGAGALTAGDVWESTAATS